jgi:hypothetical protein
MLATRQDYEDITRTVRKLPKKVQVRILEGEYAISKAGDRLCVNIPIFDLEKLYEQLDQLRRAVKRKR